MSTACAHLFLLDNIDRRCYHEKILSFLAVMALVLSVFSCPALSLEAVALSKFSIDLQKTLGEMDSSDVIELYMQFEDINHDEVLAAFAKQFPEEYDTYLKAKMGVTSTETSEDQKVVLQSAIEKKRAVYKQFYTAFNEKMMEQVLQQEQLIYVSELAPIAIIQTDKASAMRIARSQSVLSLSECCEQNVDEVVIPPTIPPSSVVVSNLDISNEITRADILRDTYNLSGDGVKIGILDKYGLPDATDPYLQNAEIITRPGESITSVHATHIALILGAVDEDGVEHGIVPDATFYCAYFDNNYSVFPDMEWLVSQGVNIINASWGTNGYGGIYDVDSQWFDHIASVHDVHFVNSAGNIGSYVSSPGMAYNATVVGAFRHNQSDDVADFTMYLLSNYMESGADRPEKPNLVANGYFGPSYNVEEEILEDYWGTSFAVPQAVGVIAQLCCWDGNLKFRQSVVGAVLAASAAEKVEAVGNGYKGDQFLSSITGCSQLNDREGAGILEARWAWGILANTNCWHYVLEQDDFPYEQSITINTNTNTLSRIAIYWLKETTNVNHSNGDVGQGNPPLTNLDLYVYDADGNLVASSTTLYNNCEIVQFVPTSPGTYIIRIVLVGTTNITEHIGVALW